MPESSVNIVLPHRFFSLAVAPSQSVEGNGMEEVVGSIPTRSTKSIINPPRVNRQSIGLGPSVHPLRARWMVVWQRRRCVPR